MTDIPYSEKHGPIFTHSLCYAMLLIILVFIVSNAFVIHSCASGYLSNNRETVCRITDVFNPLRHVVPAIYRPVELLEARGDRERANLVVAAYGFSWGSFLIVAALMCIAAVVRVRLLSDEHRRIYFSWLDQHNRELKFEKDHAATADLGNRIIILVTLFCFIKAFWGFFSFDELSYFGNMVHERNRDLYYPAIFLSFTLLFLMVFIINQIKRYMSD